MRRNLADVDDQFARLQETGAELAALAERAATLDHADCTDPHRCHVISASAEQGASDTT